MPRRPYRTNVNDHDRGSQEDRILAGVIEFFIELSFTSPPASKLTSLRAIGFPRVTPRLRIVSPGFEDGLIPSKVGQLFVRPLFERMSVSWKDQPIFEGHRPG